VRNYVTLCGYDSVDSDPVPMGKFCVTDCFNNRNLLYVKCLVNWQGFQLHSVSELQLLATENH
jgi:hypothetical protein